MEPFSGKCPTCRRDSSNTWTGCDIDRTASRPHALGWIKGADYWTWLEQRKAMISTTFNFHLIHFPTRVIWFSSGLMLLGMALFKLGVFSARRSKRFYMGMILAALLIGIPLAVYWERFLIRCRPPGTCFSRIMEKHLFSTNLPLVKIRFMKK